MARAIRHRGARDRARTSVGVAAVPLVLVASMVGLAIAMQTSTYDIWAAFWVGPVLLVCTVPFAFRAGRAEHDPRIAQAIMGAAVLKLAIGTALRYWTIFNVYGGLADAAGYDQQARALAPAFRHLDFSNLGEISGTRAIEVLTGIVYAVIGDSTLGGFLVFSWLAFLGMVCFYRAFVIAVPGGDHTRYRRLLFFFPTMWFWPSSTGKEAVLIFCVGVATYGAAKVYTGHLRGLALAGLGLWGAVVVRPHVALIMLLGLGAGVAAVFSGKGRRTADQRPGRGVVTLVAAVVLVLGVVLVEAQAARFFQVDKLDTTTTSDVFDQVNRRTSEGGSRFEPITPRDPVTFGEAVVTVLFRPFPGEVGGAQGVISGIEGACLLVLTAASIGRLVQVPVFLRRSRLVVASLVVTIGFTYAFASIGNFGILARQRSQVLPFVFVLLALPSIGLDRTGRRSVVREPGQGESVGSLA